VDNWSFGRALDEEDRSIVITTETSTAIPPLRQEKGAKDGARSFVARLSSQRLARVGPWFPRSQNRDLGHPKFVRELTTGWDRFAVSHLRRKDKDAPKGN